MRFARLVLLGFDDDPWATELSGALHSRADRVMVLPGRLENNNTQQESLPGADALVLAVGEPAGGPLFADAPHLKYIAVCGTDHAAVDLQAAAARGITVSHVPGYSTDSVAEFVIGVMLERLRCLHDATARARQCDYYAPAGRTLRGRRLGILGLGRIGCRTAEIARQGFGAQVRYWSRRRRPEHQPGLPYAELPDLLAWSELLAIHLALTPQTRGLLGAAELALLPPGAVLVNAAPMALFDLPALEARLRAGDLSFIFDHADELSADDAARLVRYPTCMAYPPIACATQEADAQKLRILLDNLDGFLSGRPVNLLR